MGRENATTYFSQKTNIFLWLVGIIGLCMVYAGYFGERRSPIFMAVGVCLALLCGYEVIRGTRHKKKGTDLDAIAQEALPVGGFYGDALKRLCLGSGEAAECENITLEGYCSFPIRTRPYFRRDEEDGKLRTSNYQRAMFLFDDDRFFTYSHVVSLVDKENAESGRMWGYDQVVQAHIAQQNLTYLVGTSDNKRENADVQYLYLKDTEGVEYTFFFDGDADGADNAARVLEVLASHADDARTMHPLSEPDEPMDPIPDDKKSTAKGSDLSVGVIGGAIKTPRRQR